MYNFKNFKELIKRIKNLKKKFECQSDGKSVNDTWKIDQSNSRILITIRKTNFACGRERKPRDTMAVLTISFFVEKSVPAVQHFTFICITGILREK